MIIVLDTNVLLAAFGSHGFCERLMLECLEKHEIALSDMILAELAENLVRKIRMSPAQAATIVDFLRGEAHHVEPTHVAPDACRDPKDLPILGTAVAAHADCLVTGDKDLLILRRFAGIPILSPREFYEKLRTTSP